MTRSKDPDIAAEWIRVAFGWIVILLAAILLLPVLILAGIGFAQGTIPSSAAGGVFGSGPDYPAFAPPFWLLWIPALGAFALSLATWRFPGQFMDSIFSARWDLGIISFVGATTTLGAAVTFGAPYLWIILGAVVPWILALLVVLSRGVWDTLTEARAAFGPRKSAPARPRTTDSARASIPALQISADSEVWKRSRQHLTLRGADPRALSVDVYDSATNDLGLARALVRAIDGEDAAPPRSTPFTAGHGTAIRTIRTVAQRGGPRIIATWHWDDGQRAVLMTAFDVEPDRFAAAEAHLDRLAGGIRIGSL